MDINVFALVNGNGVAVFGNFQIIAFGRSDQQFFIDIAVLGQLRQINHYTALVTSDRTGGGNGNLFTDNVGIFYHVLGVDDITFLGFENTV